MVERKPLFTILILLLVLLIIVIYIVFYRIFRGKLYLPKFLTDDTQRQGTVVCNPAKTPQKCEVLGNPCMECSDGLFSCQEVKGEVLDSDGNVVGGGYTVTDGDSTRTLPEGKWCLPTTVESNPCNPFTSDPILTKVNDSLYRWVCNCKYPQWIESTSVGENCNKQIACNHQRDPTNNYLIYCKNQGNYKTVIGDDGEWKVACEDGSDPIRWTNSSKIQLDNAFCQCGPGSYYFENKETKEKECIPNPCGEGGRVSYDASNNMFCICPQGKVSCSQLMEDKQQECGEASCIKDPCAPNGTLNGKGTCDCKTGYQFVEDNNYLPGGYCEKFNDACNLLGDTCNEFRGGECTTCMEPTGEVSMSVPYCYNCSYYKGFNNIRKPDCKEGASNCTPCALWFVNPHTEFNYTCCTGRNHKYGGIFKRGHRQCQPCNDPTIKDDDSRSDKKKKQKRWDENCLKYYREDIDDGAENIPARMFCNSYNIGDYTDWSADGRIGICETTKRGDGNRNAKDRDMTRYD